jgi:peptidoglycan/xylan/chitin deacetylase (PgdA/CDA1 family)
VHKRLSSLVVIALLVVAGCGTASPRHGAAVAGYTMTPVAPATAKAPTTPPGSGPGTTAPITAPPTSKRPTAPPKPVDSLAALLAKLPHFGPAPAAVPIDVPEGSTAPIYFRLPVKAKVAFLTIDDGIVQLPQDVALMHAAHIPFTMFLIAPLAKKHPAFFEKLEDVGGRIEDHTLTHTDLRGKSYAVQKNEICGARTMLTKSFGRAPVLFRPPYGAYDRTTLQAVHDCGMTAAIHWSETARNGKVFYQTTSHTIKPGDIILMHFRSTFASDLLAALNAIHRAGLTPARLEDYIS